MVEHVYLEKKPKWLQCATLNLFKQDNAYNVYEGEDLLHEDMKTRARLLLTMKATTPFCKRCWCTPSFRPYVLSMFSGDRLLAEATRI